MGRLLRLGSRARRAGHGRGRGMDDACRDRDGDQPHQDRRAGHPPGPASALGAGPADRDARSALRRPVVVGVGLGDDGWREFSAFGDETVPRVRGELLDESLQILQGLLTGNEVVHAGGRYVIDCPPLLPAPVQDPVPIWAAVRWPNRKPLARAARLQGCFPIFAGSGDRPAPPPAGPGVIPPVAGVPELLPARDHRPGQHADDRPQRRHRLGAGVGRRSAYSPRTSCRCRSPVISIGRRPVAPGPGGRVPSLACGGCGSRAMPRPLRASRPSGWYAARVAAAGRAARDCDWRSGSRRRCLRPARHLAVITAKLHCYRQLRSPA